MKFAATMLLTIGLDFCAALTGSSWGLAEELHAVDPLASQLVDAALVYDEKAIVSICSELAEMRVMAVPALSDLVEHANGVVRWKAIETLEEIGPTAFAKAEQLLSRLVAASMDADADVRAASVTCTARWFPGRWETLNAIEKLTNDNHGVVQANAWFACWSVRREQRAVVALTALLSHQDWMAAEKAEQHLVSIGDPAISALLAATRDTLSADSVLSSSQKARYVRTLAGVGQTHARARDVLQSLLKQRDLVVVQSAVDGLVLHRISSALAFESLLKSADPLKRVIGLGGIERLGRDAANTVPSVERLLSDDLAIVRLAAIAAYPAVIAPTPKTVDRYLLLLTHRDADVRAAAVTAIKHWPSAAKALIPALHRIAATDDEDFARQSARATLAQLQLAGPL